MAPLSNLTRLEWLGLDNNSISDLAPLVANAGLGEGDWIEVSNNPLSATSINTHIPALQSRGISVLYTPGGGSGGVPPPTPPPGGGSATDVVIPDANLHAIIATSLGKSIHAPITQAEMATLTRLNASNENIRDLTGLEFAINLTELVLGGNEGRLGEVNINELFNNLSLYLTNLIELWINFSFNFSVNSISDVTPLSNLTRLRVLDLSYNSISDLAALS
ncbi:MAG: hypothetical protein F4175_07160 [Gemmatimonadetes bacterium]|nr:hypothetical protein [Gemmatimonadota bacterium]